MSTACGILDRADVRLLNAAVSAPEGVNVDTTVELLRAVQLVFAVLCFISGAVFMSGPQRIERWNRLCRHPILQLHRVKELLEEDVPEDRLRELVSRKRQVPQFLKWLDHSVAIDVALLKIVRLIGFVCLMTSGVLFWSSFTLGV